MRLLLRRRSILFAFALIAGVSTVRADDAFRVTGPTQAPAAIAPPPLEKISDEGLDFRSLNTRTWDEYNAAFELDRSGEADPAAKARSWRRLAAEAPQYSALASKRASLWEEFAERKKTERQRVAARNSDWQALVKLLESSTVPDNDKTRWTAEFLNAYADLLGIKPGMSPEDTARAAQVTMRKAMGARALEKGDPILWASIPAGSFTMGSEDADLSDSRPAHRVTVNPFQMAKTLVTNKQYKACVDAGACSPPHEADGLCLLYSSGTWERSPLPATFQGDNQPVVCVSFEQAREFSEWVGGRLPSEAEWEYAARSAGKDWKYPWGNDAPTCTKALMRDCSDPSLGALVCSRPAGSTLQGLCDMAGSAWEWVEDSYHDSYVGAPTDGSAWEVAGSSRVTRGGSLNDDPLHARSAYRNEVGDGSPYSYNVGFRPVR